MKKENNKVELLEIYDVEGYQRPSDGGSSSSSSKDKSSSGSKSSSSTGNKVSGSSRSGNSNGNRGVGGNVTTSSKNSNNNNNNTLKPSTNNSKNQSNNVTLKTATKTAINIAGNFLEGAVGLGSKLLSTTMEETKGNSAVKKVVTTTPTKKVATSPTPKVYNGNDYKGKIVTKTSTNVLDSKLSDPLKSTLKTDIDLKSVVQDSMDVRKVAKKAAQDTGNVKKGNVLDGGGVYKKSVTVGDFKQAEEKQNQKNAIKKQEMDKKLAIYKDSNGGYSLPWQQSKGMDKSTQKMIGNMQNHLEKNENQLGWLGVGNSIKNALKNDTIKNFNEKYNPGVVNLGINYALHINGGGSLEKGIVISKDGKVAVYRTETLGAMSDLEASANISFGFSKNIKSLEQFSGDSVYLSQSADALWNITVNKSVSEKCSATTFSYGGAVSFSPYEIEAGKSTTEIVKEIK